MKRVWNIFLILFPQNIKSISKKKKKKQKRKIFIPLLVCWKLFGLVYFPMYRYIMMIFPYIHIFLMENTQGNNILEILVDPKENNKILNKEIRKQGHFMQTFAETLKESNV